jgi:hypothetical protein
MSDTAANATFLYPRDASWHRRPGRGVKYHRDREGAHGWAACSSGIMLNCDVYEEADDLPNFMRCQRKACQ